MDPSELSLLEADLAVQAREIERIYNRIDERERSRSRFAEESLSYQLHNLYCAFKQLFEIVAQAFECHVSRDAGYHTELLRRMNAAIPGVRPALVPAEILPLLDSLRSFRHFFRHAYSQEIDRRKVKPVASDARRLRDIYPGMVQRFLEELRK